MGSDRRSIACLGSSARRPLTSLSVVCAVAVSAALLAGCRFGSESGSDRASETGVLIARALRAVISAQAGSFVERPPPATSPLWEEVSLPEFWPARRRLGNRHAWYRSSVVLPQPPGEAWSVYLPRVAMNARVLVNGVAIGSGGRMEEPVARSWNRPLLLRIPAGLLRPGQNHVDVQLRLVPTALGLIFPYRVGPDALLAPLHARAWLWRVSLIQVLSWLMLGSAALIGATWLSARDQPAHPWYVAGAVLWSINLADFYVGETGIPTRLWQWAIQTGLVGAMVCFTLAAYRYFELRRRARERLLLAFWAVGSLGFGVLPVPAVAMLAGAFAFSGIALSFNLGLLLARQAWARRGRSSRAGWVGGLACLAMLAAAHDLALPWTGGGSVPDALLHAYTVPVGVVLSGAALIGRYTRLLSESRASNAELESRVEARRREIEAQHQRLRELEAQRAVSEERDRLLREMHDGVGGQLAGALALVEKGGVPAADVADALRDSLDDLRLLLDSMDTHDADLAALLGALRPRLERRTSRHGLKLLWNVEDVPEAASLGPDAQLEVLRILQEALTNVVRHAGAGHVTLSCGSLRGPDGRAGMYVELRDDGCGWGGSADEPSGRGLRHMQARARRLGGELVLGRQGGETRVRLWLPAADERENGERCTL